MKTNVLFLFALLVLFSVASCSDDDNKDTEKPTIVVTAPVAEAEFEPGEKLKLDVKFEDNEMLKEYKVDIHFNDGHEHKKSEDDHDHGHTWTYTESWPLGKKSEVIKREFLVPTVIDGEPIKGGDYHFGIFVTDEAGNETSQYIDIEIHTDHDHHHEEGHGK